MAYTEKQKQQHIRELQTFLHGLSHVRPTIHIIPDGIYGKNTTAAVQEFQKQNHLQATGKTDTETWNALASAYRNEVQSPTMQISIFPPGIPFYSLGDTGTAVWILQSILASLAYYENLPEVIPNGTYDMPTQNAVLAFQKSTTLPSTGRVDFPTWNHILAAVASEMDSSWH